METENKGPRYSLRKQSFLFFTLGERPVVVARLLKMKKETAFRYFQDWKNQSGDYIIKYKAAKTYWKRLSGREIKVIAQTLADELETSTEAVIQRMQQPWAVKQIVTGEWRNWELPKKEKQQPSRLLKWTGRILYRKSEEVDCLLELIFHQERIWYCEYEDKDEEEEETEEG